MAGDWIKIRIDLTDDPNVFIMSDILSLDCPTVVGHLVMFWSWMDRHTANGQSLRLTESVIDKRVGVPGFASALRNVGWLEGDDMSLSIPKFDRHNGGSAKARALEAEAKRLRRLEKTGAGSTHEVAHASTSQPPAIPGAGPEKNVRQVSDKMRAKSRTREEKRREDIKDNTNTYPDARARELADAEDDADSEVFPMHIHWQPRPVFAERCAMAGIRLALVPPAIRQQLFAEFMSYWETRPDELNQAKWEHKLLQRFIEKNNRGELLPADMTAPAATGKARSTRAQTLQEQLTDRSWAE